MSITRQCADCHACCVYTQIDEGEFHKPACVACPFLDHGCSIHNTPKMPKVCSDFQCAWLRGHGSGNDRPDKSKVLISINMVNKQPWIFVMDLSPNAHQTSGKNIIQKMAQDYDLPLIIVDYKNLKSGSGDYVIIKDSLLNRCKNLAGERIIKLGKNLYSYHLLKN